MKFFVLFLLCFASNFAISDSLKIGENIAGEVIHKIDAEKITNDIYTPNAYHFIKKDQSTPTCSLVDRKNQSNLLEIMSPEEMEYPNCNKIWRPIITKIGSDYYATYRYDVEDPKKVFTSSYQLVKIAKDGFYKCKQNDSINELLQQKKTNTSAAIRDVIKIIGCTPLADDRSV
ncbi:hypothetical protein [Herbaspirillum sp. RV1423]|uniref:hypothetical protein n=1 Tax=Herbaspirillum sp. RV1423 TaxID=1443993 RepID=UPI0005547C11|nr:hypothetical protein [Herbaspirillum sp. RV1423]